MFQSGLTGTITLTSGQIEITQPLTITGLGAKVAISGNKTSRIFNVSASDVTISGLTIKEGNGDYGGGIFNTGTLTVTNSTLLGNQASSGGGIFNNSYSTLTVSNSTLSGNQASSGGGIYNYGTLTVSNSTLSGNQASSGSGGGICNHDSYGMLTVTNSVVSGNSAPSGSGKEIYSGQPSFTPGYNLFGENGDPGVVNAAQLDTDLILDGLVNTAIGPLADNGGPTQTHALVTGSPAINKGNNALIPADVTTDQRGTGFPRIVDSTVDIGAVEGTASPTTHALAVGKSGGNGTVTSNPAGINCGATCTANFNSGTSVTLTASPDSGYTFSGWSGDCNGTSCTVTMDAAKSVTALFANAPPPTYLLTVSKAGTGTGTVTSSPAGIDCGATCSANLSGSVTLTATPASGSTFSGWSGDCNGASCTVTMDAAKNVTALFANAPPLTYPVTTVKAGNGTGTITGAGNYVAGASVILTATPNVGSTFAGWSPSPCAARFTMPANPLNCIATFTAAGSASASQQAPNYRPGSTLTVTGTLNDPSGNNPLALVWRPTLPTGWTLTGASGDGIPQVSGNKILFTGSFAGLPITFTYQVAVPANSSGPQSLSAKVEYQNSAMVNPVIFSAQPNPLILNIAYHSADYRKTYWQIDSSEASRVLAYWRAGAYHVEPAGLDGYATGAGSTSGSRHSADYRKTYWQIDSSEASRVLAYWRAGAYHVEPTGVDGYAPGAAAAAGINGQPAIQTAVATANHRAALYTAGGKFTVSNSVQVPASTKLLSLVWRPTLPTGWTIVAVSGDGGPQLRGNEILFTARTFATNPLQFSYEVAVPANNTGVKTLSAKLEYLLTDMVNARVQPVNPNPLRLAAGQPLTVVKTGNGIVTSAPAGINCGTTCTANFAVGTVVNLRPLPASGSAFTGWRGACSGTGACRVTLNAAKSVTATFTPLTLGIADVSQTEGHSGTKAFVFTVTLSAASPRPVTVRYATANGTATAGSDYTAARGTLTFGAGQTRKTIKVMGKGDTAVEADEKFFVNLSSPVGATLADGQGTGTIRNDD